MLSARLSPITPRPIRPYWAAIPLLPRGRLRVGSRTVPERASRASRLQYSYNASAAARFAVPGWAPVAGYTCLPIAVGRAGEQIVGGPAGGRRARARAAGRYPRRLAPARRGRRRGGR